MAVLNYFQISDLRRELEERFSVRLHMHDTCGALYFSFDEAPGDDVRAFLAEYLRQPEIGNMRIVWMQDGLSFALADA